MATVWGSAAGVIRHHFPEPAEAEFCCDEVDETCRKLRELQPALSTEEVPLFCTTMPAQTFRKPPCENEMN